MALDMAFYLPKELVSGIEKLFPEAIFYKHTTERVVALTVDDAPCPQDTEYRATRLILETIARHNQNLSLSQQAKATFFIISSHLDTDYPILERIIAEGHEVGNHGVFDDTYAWLTATEFERQLQEAQEKLLNLTGKSTIRWYRPGRGLYNQSMLRAIANLTAHKNYDLKLVLASMIPFDTFGILNNPLFTAWYVKQMIFPGAILVLHAGLIKIAQQTASSLKLILEELTRRNYRAVTMSQLWDDY